MGTSDQIKSFVNNILAGAAWDFLKRAIGSSALMALAAAIWEKAKHGSVDWLGIFGLFVIACLAFGLAFRKKSQSKATTQLTQTSNSIVPGIPTLSSLLGNQTAVSFDAKSYFARAYYSPVTAEAEKNIKIIAAHNSPGDLEAFYARFIGVGLVAYWHDITWFTIYGSQLEVLQELNGKGMLPSSRVKSYYDSAAAKFPVLYKRYTFVQWMDYMKQRGLIVWYPSDMVDITHHGKDFMKYLTHGGVDARGKAY